MGSFPMGVRFNPTDVELLNYLMSFITCEPMPSEGDIQECDVYEESNEPWKLFENTSSDVLYFFSPLKRISQGGTRFSRCIGQGTWKGKECVSMIKDKNKKIMGFKRGLRYTVDKKNTDCPSNVDEWLLKEYHLSDTLMQNTEVKRKDYVLCRITRKRNKSHNVEMDELNDEGKGTWLDEVLASADGGSHEIQVFNPPNDQRNLASSTVYCVQPAYVAENGIYQQQFPQASFQPMACDNGYYIQQFGAPFCPAPFSCEDTNIVDGNTGNFQQIQGPMVGPSSSCYMEQFEGFLCPVGHHYQQQQINVGPLPCLEPNNEGIGISNEQQIQGLEEKPNFEAAHSIIDQETFQTLLRADWDTINVEKNFNFGTSDMPDTGTLFMNPTDNFFEDQTVEPPAIDDTITLSNNPCQVTMVTQSNKQI